MSSAEQCVSSISVVLHQNASLIQETSAEIDMSVSLLNNLSTQLDPSCFTLRTCEPVRTLSNTVPDVNRPHYACTLLLSNPSRETLVGIGYHDIREGFPFFCQIAPLSSSTQCLATLADVNLLFGIQLRREVSLRKTWRLLNVTLRNGVEAGGALAPEMQRILASLGSDW